MTPCPYSRKFSNGVLFVCTLEANHRGRHLMWKASKTCAEQGNRTPVRDTIGAENEMVRASLRTTPDPASPTKED